MNLAQRIALAWRIVRQKPGNLMSHADRELPKAGDDDMQALMNQQLREIILVFGTHGHSGSSASWAVSALEKLLRFAPLGPITEDDSEWGEVGDGMFQNLRCSHVFMDINQFNGQPYDINAIVFREPSGACYIGPGSRQPITLPYTPKTEYVDVP